MSSYADRLSALRVQLQGDGLDGFVVPLTGPSEAAIRIGTWLEF